jgi:hypothetical protein
MAKSAKGTRSPLTATIHPGTVIPFVTWRREMSFFWVTKKCSVKNLFVEGGWCTRFLTKDLYRCPKSVPRRTASIPDSFE